jgi:hypothetical protein
MAATLSDTGLERELGGGCTIIIYLRLGFGRDVGSESPEKKKSVLQKL